MKIERDADDDLRRLPARARAVRGGPEARVRGRGLRGDRAPARSSASAASSATSTRASCRRAGCAASASSSTRPRRRWSGAAAAARSGSAIRSSVRVDGVEAARGRVDLVAAGERVDERSPSDSRSARERPDEQEAKRKAASGDVATNRRPATSTSSSRGSRPGSSCAGTEVKSLRDGKAQIGDAYAVIEDGEVWLRNAHIPPYEPAAREPRPRAPAQAAPAPLRDRAPDRAHAAQGPDPDPDPDLLQGPAGEGRAGARARQGAARPPPRDPRPRRRSATSSASFATASADRRGGLPAGAG